MAAQFDELIHQPMRLKITSMLNVLPKGDMLEFGRLKAVLNATDGNLGTHIAALEKAAYIEVAKDFVGKKPRTRIALTAEGRKAFQGHIAFLKTLIEES